MFRRPLRGSRPDGPHRAGSQSSEVDRSCRRCLRSSFQGSPSAGGTGQGAPRSSARFSSWTSPPPVWTRRLPTTSTISSTNFAERGVTIILTTHRIEEAERLCDHVHNLATTLRTKRSGQNKLRDRLFAKTLTVETATPLAEPGRVFDGIAGVENWRSTTKSSYAIAVSNTRTTAPAVADLVLVAANADVLSLTEARHTLEDVYLELIDHDHEADNL